MTNTSEPGGSRFRLRFLLQEYSLLPGETLIGRSDECQITIFDPLISRKHARIRVVNDQAFLDDLGSKNGCRVNGMPIPGTRRLQEGDRVRIGKHDLVFGERPILVADPPQRITGSLVYCAGCDTPYSKELGMCPACGVRDALDEDTRSGVFDENGKERWVLDMLVELFDRALSSSRPVDAERIMRQIMSTLEGYLKNFHKIEAHKLEPMAACAIKLADTANDAFWVGWATDFFQRAGAPLSSALSEAATRWDEIPTTQVDRQGREPHFSRSKSK